MTETAYNRLGGEDRVRELVDRFYDHMDSLPNAAKIRSLHPKDLTTSRDKLFKFLSGWLGGPPLYMQEFGHPRLRARHLPFPIGREERDAWLYCMRCALDDLTVSVDLREQLMSAFSQTADFMRNNPRE